jgi:NnrS protein
VVTRNGTAAASVPRFDHRAAATLLLNPHPLLLRTSLALALAFGFTVGLYLIIGFAFGAPLAASAPALMQVHGQAQALGFVALFIMAVSVQLFPRFHSSRLDRPWLISTGGLLLAFGLLLRALTQPLSPQVATRAAGLVASGILELLGIAIAVYAFARVIRRGVQPGPRGAGALLPMTMAGSLMSALALNLYACLELARGALVVSFALDEALLHLELWGFASTMVLMVGGRVFPRFLLLQPTRERLLPYALALWAAGSFGVPAVWLVLEGAAVPRAVAALCQLAGGCMYVLALRLYDTPARASGMPNVTNPTRRWARLAFALMLVAAAANFGLAAAEFLGFPSTMTGLSAARHALAQGFLLPVIVVMAARILPGYSGHMLPRPRLLAGMVWALLVGAALRFVAEFVGGYTPGWAAIVALGGTLGVVSFVVFAVGLWRATGRAPALGSSAPASGGGS